MKLANAQQFDEVGSMTARLKGLQDDVDETVFMGIQNGPYGQYVLALPKESSRSMRALSGQMKLLTMSATGRVLLSLKSDTEAMRWVHRCNAEAEHPNLQIAAGEFLGIIAKIREQGFAETQGDVTPSFGAFAVRLCEFTKHALASSKQYSLRQCRMRCTKGDKVINLILASYLQMIDEYGHFTFYDFPRKYHSLDLNHDFEEFGARIIRSGKLLF